MRLYGHFPSEIVRLILVPELIHSMALATGSFTGTPTLHTEAGHVNHTQTREQTSDSVER